jgi:hypothetical protein
MKLSSHPRFHAALTLTLPQLKTIPPLFHAPKSQTVLYGDPFLPF